MAWTPIFRQIHTSHPLVNQTKRCYVNTNLIKSNISETGAATSIALLYEVISAIEDNLRLLQYSELAIEFSAGNRWKLATKGRWMVRYCTNRMVHHWNGAAAKNGRQRCQSIRWSLFSLLLQHISCNHRKDEDNQVPTMVLKTAFSLSAL